MGKVVAWDPSAGEGLVREIAGPGQCAWCGTKRRRLYTYTPQRNNIPSWWKENAFCNLQCFKAFLTPEVPFWRGLFVFAAPPEE